MSTLTTIPGYPTTTAHGIVLIFNGITLTLTQFGNYPGRYPRLDAQYPNIIYSLRGNDSREGTSFRAKSVWTFDAYLTLEQQAAWQRQEAFYKDFPSAFTLYDYTKPWADSGAQSRGAAPGSSIDTTNGQALYYAAFNAEPTREVQFVERNARGDLLSFQFRETGATTP